MAWMGEFWRRIWFRLRGARFEEDLDEEMRLHMDLRAAEKQAEGMDGGVAEEAVQRRFGNLTRLKENSREAWGWTFLDTVGQDLRYGLRALAANPGFTAAAVLSLALGVGANTAIFSILNAVMLRTLPVEDPRQLVQITLGRNSSLTNPIWEQVRDNQQAFSGVLAYSGNRFDLADGGESRFVNGIWVSGDFFGVLGVPAIEGRVFTPDDDRRGGGVDGNVAVISQDFRNRHFAGDSSVIGKTIRLNRNQFVIVGVTPAWFTGLDVDRRYDVAIPLACDPIMRPGDSALDHRSYWWLQLLGRLPPDVSMMQAQDRMRAIAPGIFRDTLPPNFSEESQQNYLKNTFSLEPAATGFSSTGTRYRTALFALMAMVGLVLLIACANIANLLLARAAARQRELSVRMAIGASRKRVTRQLMTESFLLAALGTVGGLLLAFWSGKLLVKMISTTRNPVEIDLGPDLNVLVFTAGVTILTAVLFGMAPALRATRIEVNRVLKENARGALSGSTRFNMGKALVAGQIALSLVLLVGAGLFLGTLRNLLTADAGFSRDNLLLATVNVQQASVPEQRRVAVYQEILDRLRILPGVTSASSSLITPISGFGWNQPIYPEGFTVESSNETLTYFNRISPGYFKTMQTPLLIGRDFNERDDLNSPKVMIIGEATARKFFGSINPVGKTIGVDRMNPREEKDLYQVIGVVKDTKYISIDEETEKVVYVSTLQDPAPWANNTFELRSSGPLESLTHSIRSVIAEVNPAISLEFSSLETQVSDSLLQQRIVALLSSVFGALALVLAMVGLYGITSYAVARRRGEIGIRMALGAQRGAVAWLVLRDVAVLLAIGMALGLAASLAAGRLVTSLLYGVRWNDPVQLAGAAIVLITATAIAAYLPARRAARLDPMVTLREE